MAKKKKRDRKLPPASEEKILNLLGTRYAAPVYAFLWQVRNGTGWTRSQARTADALAMSLWPSRGLELIGFEVKSNRSDWLNEMRNPAKAEEICRFCDRWYIVAAAADIVDEGELPPNWGLIVVEKGRLRTAVRAEKFEDVQELDKPMLCAILRKVVEIAVPQAKLDSAYNKGYTSGCETGERVAASDVKFGKLKIEDLEKDIRDFEKASGVKIDGWDGAKAIGEAVKMVLNDQHTGMKRQLERFRDTIARLLEDTDKAIAAVKEPTPAESPT